MARTKTQEARIGPAVRRFRLGAGMTQAQLADLADVATETVSRIETGRMPVVSMALCGRLASALGVTAADLLKTLHEPTRSTLRPPERALLALVRGLDDATINDLVRSVRLMIGVARRIASPPRK